jgi:hypothetical protein
MASRAHRAPFGTAVKKGLTLARYLDYIDQENTSADPLACSPVPELLQLE